MLESTARLTALLPAGLLAGGPGHAAESVEPRSVTVTGHGALGVLLDIARELKLVAADAPATRLRSSPEYDAGVGRGAPERVFGAGVTPTFDLVPGPAPR